MKLKLFDNQTHPERAIKSRMADARIPRVSLHPKNGTITFNPAACEKFGIKEGDTLKFAQDEDRPKDWYIVLAAYPNGFTVRALRLAIRPEKPTIQVKRKGVVQEILKSLDKEEGVAIPLGELTMEGKNPIIPLLTAAAYPTKTYGKKCTPANESTSLPPKEDKSLSTDKRLVSAA